MPYRRLPNTDNARLKALHCANEKGKEIPPFKLAFSQCTLQKVQSFLPRFENSLNKHKNTYARQVSRNKEYQELVKKSRLYISHFIQVVNMSILRGEHSPGIREYYNLNGYGNKLPPLNSEEEIIQWGRNLIEGESERKMEGRSPVTNPTIAVVKVRYEKFLEACKNQKMLQNATNRCLNELAAMRPEANEIILNVWNEVEESFRDLPEGLRREKAREYGLNYVFRKNENPEQDFFDRSRRGIS